MQIKCIRNTRVGHNETCCLRVMEQASTNPAVAERVKTARARETELFEKTSEKDHGEGSKKQNAAKDKVEEKRAE